MRPRVTTAALLIAATALAACETGRDAYERPLRVGNVLEDEAEPTASAGGVAFAGAPSIGSMNDVDGGAPELVHGDRRYRLADLSPGERPDPASDEAGWWMQMGRAENRIRTSGKLVRDPQLTRYIREIACRVAGPHCADIRVYIVQNPVFNAFMMANGTMVVHTGFLLRARSEAELAAVLGHEAGHYLRRHTHQRMQDVIAKEGFLTFFAMAVGVAGLPPEMVDSAATIMKGSIFAYSRDQEREADGYGLLLLYRSGYDPLGAAAVWDRIIRENEAAGISTEANFYSTHPSSEERRDVLAELGDVIATKMGNQDEHADRFFEHILPHRTEWLRQETHLRSFKRSSALLDMLLEDDPNPAEILYFKGELHRLRNNEDEEDAHKALDLYEQALAAEGTAPPNIHRSMGLLYRRQDAPERAVDALRAYLEAVPDAEDRLVVEQLINRMTTS